MPQSDIFALGATLHHMLTGRDPRHEPPFSFPLVYALRPDISRRTSDVIQKAVQMKVEDRYPSVAEFRQALLPSIQLTIPLPVGKLPPQPPPVAPSPSPRKQKHFARFGVGAAIAAILVFGFLWMFRIVSGDDPFPTPISGLAPTLTPSPAPMIAPTLTPNPNPILPISGCDSKARDYTEPRLWRQEPNRMSGPKVEFLQRRLLELGYQLPNSGADGWFGPETEAAVKEFQRRNGLEVDGIVGPITWACLKNPNAARASD